MSLPWWMTEEGYQAPLKQGREDVANKHLSRLKRIVIFGTLILLGAIFVTLKLWVGLVRLRKQRSR